MIAIGKAKHEKIQRDGNYIDRTSASDFVYLEWTTEPPTETDDGKEYRIYYKDYLGQARQTYARVSFDYYSEKRLCYYQIGDEVPRLPEDYDDFHWLGPLPQPEPPQEKGLG